MITDDKWVACPTQQLTQKQMIIRILQDVSWIPAVKERYGQDIRKIIKQLEAEE